MSVTVTGVRELAAELDQFGDNLERLDLSRVGDQTQAHLQVLSPVRTGVLRSSWEVTAAAGSVSVGSDLVYAAVQNVGGYHNITGRHFVERTAALVTDDAGRLVASEIDRLIDRM